MNMEVVNQQANSVDFALQAMAVNSGVNSNSLETLIAVRCEIVTHVPIHGGLGMFFLRGSKLLPTTNKVLTETRGLPRTGGLWVRGMHFLRY